MYIYLLYIGVEFLGDVFLLKKGHFFEKLLSRYIEGKNFKNFAE